MYTIQQLPQEEVAFENCTGSTVTDAIELPQSNVCKEPVEEPRYVKKDNVQELYVLCTKYGLGQSTDCLAPASDPSLNSCIESNEACKAWTNGQS